MTGVTLTHGGLDWRFWPEPSPPRAARWQVIASAQLIDELTGLPARTAVEAASGTPGLLARASAGGLVGIVGRPAALYPAPWPAIPPAVRIEISGPGFLPLELAGDLPPQPTFPDQFGPLDFGTVALHRTPTRVSGRAVEVDATPVAGATVAVTRIWTTFDDIAGPGDPPDGLSLLLPLRADRPAGATVRERPLNLLPGGKSLLQPVGAGSVRLKLSDRQGLALNQPLAVEPGDPERTEYGVPVDIETGSSPDQAAWVTLAFPLVRAHRQGSDVVPVGLGVPGASNQLLQDARQGDQTLLLDGLAGFAPGQTTLEISGGGLPDEYHAFSLWRDLTAADGGFRLPPLHRLAHVELTASGGGQPQPARRIISLSGWPDAIADMVFA